MMAISEGIACGLVSSSSRCWPRGSLPPPISIAPAARVTSGSAPYARVDVSAGYTRLAPPPGPIVVAPTATYLVAPPPAPRPGLAYAPPPVPTEPPPLITALPIIGPYLVLPDDGPPPATVLDAYDHRYDYNQ